MPVHSDAAQFAVVTEFGKPVEVITKPGLRLPPYQSIRTFDRRLFTYGRPAGEFLSLKKPRLSLRARSYGVSLTRESFSRPSSIA